MTGGLIQLVTTGVQDSPIIGNPEITFFKTVYRQHTMFSLCQNERFIGNLQFDKESTKILEKNGDLLYNQYFKLEIPYFKIIETLKNSQVVEGLYDLNQLDITYTNSHCLVFHFNNEWYIVPEKLFSLSGFLAETTQINSNLVQPNLLPEYISILDLGTYMLFYQIKPNDTSSMISILRIYSNFWEQFWLNFIDKTDDPNILNKLLSIKSEYASLFGLIKNRIFNLYWARNFDRKNVNSFAFEKVIGTDANLQPILLSETERYFQYLNTPEDAKEQAKQESTTYNFDIDQAYIYCINNFKNFSDYQDSVLLTNSLMILLILKLLYSDTNLSFTFWKKYKVQDKNIVNKNIPITQTNFPNEWKQNLNKLLNDIFETTQINNTIFDKFQNSFFLIESEIKNIFQKMDLDDPKKIYILLKNIHNRFYEIPNFQLNFNENYFGTLYQSDDFGTAYSKYQNDNYIERLNSQTNTYSELNSLFDKLDQTDIRNNLIPVDLENIYGVLAREITRILFDLNLSRGLKSFLIFWRNNVFSRLFKKYLDINNIINPGGNNAVTDYTSNRNMTFYHSIFPSNFFSYSNFSNSLFESFYKNSWVGNWNISANNFYKFLESMYEIKNILLNNVTKPEENKNFHKLSINNTYNYTYFSSLESTDNYNKINYLKVIWDQTNKKLKIKYNNFYDSRSIISLYINFNLVSYDRISNEIEPNEIDGSSLYLTFHSVNYSGSIPNNTSVILIVNFQTYLPAIYFADANIPYTNIGYNRYDLISKFDNNEPNIMNIIDGKIAIDETNENNIKVLTIEYIDKFIKPNITNVSYEEVQSLTSNFVTPGKHLYVISYYDNFSESEKSDFIEIDVAGSKLIKFSNLPISPNSNVKGRRIYRTKVQDNVLYLLKNLDDNTTTEFIDGESDNNLGVEYSIEANLKYNKLPSTNEKVIRTLIKLEKSGDLYKILNFDGSDYLLPNKNQYDEIKAMYIEELDLAQKGMKLLSNNEFTINNNGQVSLNNPANYSPDFYYYLINPNNFRNNYKLTSNKQTVPFQINETFIIEANNGNITIAPTNEQISSYIIDSDVLYKGVFGTPNTWEIVSSGLFIIKSDSPTYNNKYVQVKYDGNITANNGTLYNLFTSTNITANSGLLTDPVVNGTYIISADKLYLGVTGSWVLQNLGFYFITSDNPTYNQVYCQVQSSGSLLIIPNYSYILATFSIEALNGLLTDPVINGKYIISGDKIYKGISGSWTLQTNQTYQITSDNIIYDGQYVRVEPNGNLSIVTDKKLYLWKLINGTWTQIKQSLLYKFISDNGDYSNRYVIIDLEGNLLVNPEGGNILLLNITANTGDITILPTSTQIDAKTYIINNNILYVATLGTPNYWKTVTNSFYKLTSIDSNYADYYIDTDSTGTISKRIPIYKKIDITSGNMTTTPTLVQIGKYILDTYRITANSGLLTDPVSNDTYIISSDKLYLGIDGVWTVVIEGVYDITSDNVNYNGTINNVESDGTLSNTVPKYVANNGSLTDTVIDSSLIIVNDKLYLGMGGVWTLITSGSYGIISDNPTYNYKIITAELSGQLTILNDIKLYLWVGTSGTVNKWTKINYGIFDFNITDESVASKYFGIKVQLETDGTITPVDKSFTVSFLNEDGLIESGTYIYKVTYYNTITKIESEHSGEITFELLINDKKISIKNLPYIFENLYDSWKIYRTKKNSTVFYLVDIVNKISNNEYLDNIPDSELGNSSHPEYVEQSFYFSYPINQHLINRPGSRPDVVEVNDSSINITSGTYYYKLTYYNQLTGEETVPGPEAIITLINNSKIFIQVFTNVTDPRVTDIRVYRKDPGFSDYFRIVSYNLANPSVYLEPYTKDDGSVINYYLDDTASPTILPSVLNGNLSDPVTVDTYIFVNNRLYKGVVNWELQTSGIYYIQSSDNLSYSGKFIECSKSYIEIINIPTKNVNENTFAILKVPKENLVPNLDKFISNSTDLNFANEKGLSDFSDYLFYKSFIMVANSEPNSNETFNNAYELIKTMKTPNLYFYNIPFKINSSSVIMLNDLAINYLIPLSTQQYFIKNNEDPYYDYLIDNQNQSLTIRQVEDYEIIQKTFNPSFDEFNILTDFYSENVYADVLIDRLASGTIKVLDTNTDYKKIIDAITNSDNKYIELLQNLLIWVNNKDIYGETTIQIINKISQLNKLNDVSPTQMIYYDITKWLNTDYLIYSHYALRLWDDSDIEPELPSESNLMRFANSNKNLIRIIAPIYQYYNSIKKISDNLSNYLLDVKTYFSNHITYFNSNINYLNLSDPNNYQEEFLSFDEIKQHKFDNYYTYSGKTTINLLHPIIDSDSTNPIYKIKFYDGDDTITLTDQQFTQPTYNSQTIIVNSEQYEKNIRENTFYSNKNVIENKSEEKSDRFNYMGLVGLDSDSKFIFTDPYVYSSGDTYFKFNNNKIYQATYNNAGRYNIMSNTTDFLVPNPSELKFSLVNDNKVELTIVPNQYIYQIDITFEKNEINANSGDHLVDPVIESAYIIDSDILYQGISGIWTLVTSGYFYINSDVVTWNMNYVRVNLDGSLQLLNLPSSTLKTNFIVGNQIIEGFYEVTTDETKPTLYFKLNNLMNFDFNNILYQETYGDFSSWKVSPKIQNKLIINFKEFNLFTSELINTTIYKLGSYYYDTIQILKINIGLAEIDGSYLFHTYSISYKTIVANSDDSTRTDSVYDNVYIIDNDKLYLSNTYTITWDLVRSGLYYISSSNNSTYSGSYVKVDSDGNILPNKLDIYLYSDKFSQIQVRLGDSTVEPENNQIDKYIIDSSYLFKGTSGSPNVWTLQTDMDLLIYSNEPTYHNIYAKVDSTGLVITNLKNIEALSGNSAINPGTANVGKYIIDSDKIYLATDTTTWTLQVDAYYFISSDNLVYDGRYIKVKSDGTVEILNQITANLGLLSDPVINDSYIIYEDRLYFGSGGSWIMVESGLFWIESDNVTYNGNLIRINNTTLKLDVINIEANKGEITDPATNKYILATYKITANDGSLTDPVSLIPYQNYMIIGNKLYVGDTDLQTWQILNYGEYEIFSDNQLYNGEFVKPSFDGTIEIRDNPLYYLWNGSIGYWNYVSDGFYRIKSNISSLNNVYVRINYNFGLDIIEKPEELIIMFELNSVLSVEKPPILVKNLTIYSAFNDYEFSRKLANVGNKGFILLADFINYRFYILKINEIESKKIPPSNYHCWYLPQEYLREIGLTVSIETDSFGSVSGIDNLPNYCFYVLKSDSDQAIYYYETGSTIEINDVISSYYLTNRSIDKIYLIDNEHFNPNMGQLLKINSLVNSKENFVEKVITLESGSKTLSFDSVENLAYKSDFVSETFDVKYSESDLLALIGDNEIVLNLIMLKDSNYIYRPVVVKKSETYTIPNINFTYNSVSYSNSLVPILIDLAFETTYLDGTILSTDYLIGTIDTTAIPLATFTSGSANIIINNNTKSISLKAGTDIENNVFGLKRWTIKVSNVNESYNFYFWTLFSSDSTLLDIYAEMQSIAEPYYLPNSGDSNKILNFTNSSYEFIDSYPNAFSQNGVDLELIEETNIRDISYKYYTDTRHIDTTKFEHDIKLLNYHQIFNIKPSIEFIYNVNPGSDFNQDISIKDNANIYISIGLSSDGKKEVFPFLKSEYEIYKDRLISNKSVYYSIGIPTFISNPINLVKHESSFKIYSYEKLYLEQNEIIILDGNYFLVLGLNVFDDVYELILLRNPNKLVYSYEGYYTLGNYLRNDTVTIPKLNWSGVCEHKQYKQMDIPELYYSNEEFELKLNVESNEISNPGIFREGSLIVKLFNKSGRLYLVDKFVKLKPLDKLVYDGTVYEIINIRDGQIILDNTFRYNDDENNVFLEFVLPYEPFDIQYLEFNSNGKILNKTISDLYTIVFDIFNILSITANSGDHTGSVTLGNYIIDSDLLYIGTVNGWELVHSGIFTLVSDLGIFNNKTVLVNLGEIEIFEPITANSGSVLDPVSIGTFIIDSDKLYQGIGTEWKPIVSGIYLLSSDMAKYNNKLIQTSEQTDKHGLIKIYLENLYEVFNNKVDVYSKFINVTYDEITANLGLITEPVSVGTYIIDSDKLYIGTAGVPDTWTLAPSQYYKISSDIKKWNDLICFVDSNGNLSIYKIYHWARIWDTKAIGKFENYMTIPQVDQSNSKAFNLNNKHPIELPLTYNSNDNTFEISLKYKTDDLGYYSEDLISVFKFFYLQPVKLLGTYNWIKGIETIDNLAGTITYVFSLQNSLKLNNGDLVYVTFSAASNAIIEYYSQLKLRYNSALQPFDYNELLIEGRIDGKEIEVIRYIIKDDKIVNVQKKHNGQPIKFIYYTSIADNETRLGIENEPGYTSLYFHNWKYLNTDGTLDYYNNFVGTYHLISEQYSDFTIVHLVQIIFPNKLKFFTQNIYSYDYTNYLERMTLVKINVLNEINYPIQKIIESTPLIDLNKKWVEIIKQYNVRLIGTPQIQTINGIKQYTQEVQFVGSSTGKFSTDIFTEIYLEENSTEAFEIYKQNNRFFIKSDKYINNNIKLIYTKNPNYLLSSDMENRKIKTLFTENSYDPSIEYLINSNQINEELIVFDIKLSKINPEQNYYKYDLGDFGISQLDKTENYRMGKIYTKLDSTKINNDNMTFSLNQPIDDDKLEVSNQTSITNVYLLNDITNYLNMSYLFDPVRLFRTAKGTRISLFNNSISDQLYILNGIKPWNYWTLLNTINKVNKLEELVYDSKPGYLEWNSIDQIVEFADQETDIDFSWVTKNEYNRLEAFMKAINNSEHPNALSNYLLIRDEIEPGIINNLTNWLNNPDFFLDAKTNINNFLKYSGWDVQFDGLNLIFANDSEPEYWVENGVNELAICINNEFTFDSVLNMVYRSVDSFNKIDGQFDYWIRQTKPTDIDSDVKTFGININLLLRYLVKIGNELVELFDNFAKPFGDTPEYVYNNPIKFIINRLWEKYYRIYPLNKLSKEFSDQMILQFEYNKTPNIYSSINYYQNLSIGYTGINSLYSYIEFSYPDNTEFNFTNFTKYEPHIVYPVNRGVKLITKPIYPYTINFKSDVIKSGSTYSLDFLNGKRILDDIVIDSDNLLIKPDQIKFNSEYNIKSDEFVVVKQTTNYDIISQDFIGQLNKIKLNPVDIIANLSDILTDSTSNYSIGTYILSPNHVEANNFDINLGFNTESFAIYNNELYEYKLSGSAYTWVKITFGNYLITSDLIAYDGKYVKANESELIVIDEITANLGSIITTPVSVGSYIITSDGLLYEGKVGTPNYWSLVTSGEFVIASDITKYNYKNVEIQSDGTIYVLMHLWISTQGIPDYWKMVDSGRYNIVSDYEIFTGTCCEIRLDLTLNQIELETINLDWVDQIFYRDYNLQILSKEGEIINLIQPYSLKESKDLGDLSMKDLLELRNGLGLKKKTQSGTKLYLEFYTNKFNFLVDKTLVNSGNNSYLLIKDGTKYYIEAESSDITSNEITIITIVSPTYVETTDEYLFKYSTNPEFLETTYRPENINLIVPLEFKVISSTGIEVTPYRINSLGDNMLVLHYVKEDYKTISNTTNSWTQIKHTKKVDQDITNKINQIELLNEYKYRFNGLVPKTSNLSPDTDIIRSTTIYLYDDDDFDIDLFTGVYEPTIDPADKTSGDYIVQNMNDVTTEFTIGRLYPLDLPANIKFIQKNSWELNPTHYSLSSDKKTVRIDVPSDFEYINDSNQITYKILEANDGLLTDPVILNKYIIVGDELYLGTKIDEELNDWILVENDSNSYMMKSDNIIYNNKYIEINGLGQIEIITEPKYYLEAFDGSLSDPVIDDTYILVYNEINAYEGLLTDPVIVGDYMIVANVLYIGNAGTPDTWSIVTEGYFKLVSDIEEYNGANVKINSNGRIIIEETGSAYLYVGIAGVWELVTNNPNYYILSSNSNKYNNRYIKIESDGFVTILSRPKYYYKLNGEKVVPTNFIFSQGRLEIEWNTSDLVGTIAFEQYYIEEETGLLDFPSNSRVAKVTFDYAYQYNLEEKFYMVPYSNTGLEYYNKLLLVKTFDSTDKTGFAGWSEQTIINLYAVGKKYSGKVFDKYYDGSYICYIVSTEDEITDFDLDWTFDFGNWVEQNAQSVSLYQDTLQKADFYKQETMNQIYLFVYGVNINNEIIGLNPYTLADGNDFSPKPNKFYLVSYKESELINEFNTWKFIQTEQMKKTKSLVSSVEEIVHEPKWNLANKLFEYIRLYFGDQLMEELNEQVYQIDYHLYRNDEKKKQIEQVSKIRLLNDDIIGKKFQLYLPLSFWFSGKPGLSIPIIALPYTELRLQFKLNNIMKALSNQFTGSVRFVDESGEDYIPEIKFNLISDFILLDTLERKLFGSLSHEYVVSRYKTYPVNYVKDESVVLQKKFSGLIKDIYLIAKPSSYPGYNYFPNIKNKYDSRYERWIRALDYYKEWVKNNYIYTSKSQKEFQEDIQIVKSIIALYNEYSLTTNKEQSKFSQINRLDSKFNWFIQSDPDKLKFLMFYEDKYLGSGDPNQTNAKKEAIMTTYLKYQYSDKQIIQEISPIESMSIKVNGTELFSIRDWNYYTNVVPVSKFKSSLPTGLYTYSFSLYPTEDQYSGHLNFTNFDDIVLKINSNRPVKTLINPIEETDSNGNTILTWEQEQPMDTYGLETVIKEYNILRIMSGLGSMAWID